MNGIIPSGAGWRRLLRPSLALAIGVLALTFILSGRAPAQAARLTARWLGQDGADRVGPRSDPGPSDVQDIHIRLDGLPPGRAVKHLVIRGQGGDEWQFNGPYGPYRAELVREPRSPRADLYLEP